MKKLILLYFLATISIVAQFDEFDPDYNWYSIKGKHVTVHFHEETERTAQVVLKIAEEVWDPITSLYGYEPSEAQFIIKDIDDYSNGATYFFDNKIEIWSSALDFDLRGTHNWLRNVISHEFTHLVQIQAAMKIGRTIPAFYLQFLNYEDKRRPDILYGYPNFIASYPVATFNVPAWFAEGTAQYMRKEFNYDNWDTHRDMILRLYALDGKMLTWNQMGVFAKTSLGNESVYNAGFALTRYIAQKYGEDKLRDITHKLGKLKNFTIDAAFKDVLGKDGNEIYDEWSNFLIKNYKERIAPVKENLVEGKIIEGKGFGNFYPVIDDSSKYIYYISNKGADYFGLSSLYKYDIEKAESKIVKSDVRSTYTVIDGGKKVIYAKLSEKNPKWRKIHDLFMYDIENDEETRLTYGLRANNPSLSNDKSKIVFLFQKDGTTNIGLFDISSKNFRKITLFNNGEQVYNPKFSPDDSKIIFGYSYANGRDVAVVNTDGSNLKFLLNDDFDERNAFYLNQNEIVYSSDETGIFNLYKKNLITNKKVQLTNVMGGAFMASSNSKGDLVYAGYTSDGYKIFQVESGNKTKVKKGKSYVKLDNPPLNSDKSLNDYSIEDFKKYINYNDRDLKKVEKTKYSSAFTKMSILPFIRYDNYNTSNKAIDKIKPGVYLTSSDMLNRYSLFAGGSINTRLERDLFLNFIYRNKIPLLYSLGLKPELSFEIYSISRKADVDILFGVDRTNIPYTYDSKVNTDVTYNLFEVDLAAKHKIFNPHHDLEFRFIYSSYSAAIGSFIFPNTTTLYPSSSDDYLIGRNFQIQYTHKTIVPTVDSDINPVGYEVEATYNYESNKYNPESEYEVEDGVLIPVYNNYNFHRVELNFRKYLSVYKDHTVTTRFRAASILGPKVPDFFDFYLGGLIGMKSYPFYAISGNELAWINFTYRFPLLKNIDARLGHLYIDKLYFSLHGDFGNAWTGNSVKLNEFKKGAGAEIRLKMISFYVFPTSIFLNASYAFDKFTKNVNEKTITYGNEWRIYGGILFDFGL